jgi:transposase
VYWIALHDILTDHGIRVVLVNARNTKNIPGRKSEDHKRSRTGLLIPG